MILAVDGGATKTVAIVLDEDKMVIKGVGVSGPSNLTSAGRELAKSNISDSVQQSLKQASIGFSDVSEAIFGIAGIGDSKGLTKMGEDIVNEITGREDFLKINDGMPAYMLANLNEEGIVFAGGTGSVAFYLRQEKLNRVGGWNWFVGDDGSASWIAKRALNLATQQYDGIIPGKSLVEAAEDYFQNEFREVVADIEMKQDKRYVAGFASRVSALARNGDPVSLRVLWESAQYIRSLLESVRLKFERSPKISLVGGTMLAGDVYINMITDGFSENIETFYGYQVAIGGLLMILQRTGREFGPPVRKTLLDQLERKVRVDMREAFEKYLITKL